ncbi:PREDICTED: general transcription factor 3C polypeptide 1 isoform X2 [Wasmannia auropunctata]|uniref:general transcription factor 3C polypeptide 1 isoform X2 n=1 Tax=Wasmannia auropunctata TaxID=64793 RepID=UPI0005EFA643|nr:PREDICTED: general transcription factor 3C polypeptide 1 isoform X2 [Wasmannia auropunctata]
MAYPTCNLAELIVDEVALEGLDGITLQALWLRLANRYNESQPFTKFFMEQVWLICTKVKDFQFYELETPREPLVIFDRYEFVHPDLGIILEPPTVPPDIYPHCPIQDFKTGVRGSCATYYTRKDITDAVRDASLDEMTEKYGLSLVIVASQRVRTQALMGVNVNPTLELTIMRYCFLERVGRARYHGEVTQGKLSLAALKEDPKTLFYHRKFLLQHKLITKQVHHQKSAGHCGSGSLLHLTRFYVERKPKMIYLAEQVLDILRTKENGVAEYDEIKKKLGIENSIKKLFRTAFFQKIVKTDITVPYRTLYPKAESNEWRQKQDPSKEKKIRVVQVLYPDVDVADIWNKEEKDDDEDIVELDVSNHKFSVPYLKQANAIIEARQSEGISQARLGKEMGLTKLQARSFLRNMVKSRIIATYMDDMGRQRITKYVSKKFEKSSKMSKQFNKEVHKIKELSRKIISKSKENLRNTTISQAENEEHSAIHEDDQTSKKSCIDRHVDETDVDAPVIEDKTEEEKDIYADAKKEMELKNLFYVVNGILRKYQLSKFGSKYRCTTSKSLLMKPKDSDSNAKEQKAKLDAMSTSMQQIVNDAKATSFYNSIKTNLIAQKPIRTGKGISEVFGFMEVVQNSENKNSNITYRLLRRANMIIEAVKEHQVIDDTAKLMKMIYEEEDKEGYDVKIDKKSLIRLLQKLAKDNLVKNIKLTLSANGREKNLTFICDPNIDTDHTVIKSAVEQAKVKFCLLASQKARMLAKKTDKQDKADKTDKSSGSKERLQEPNKTASKLSSVNYKYDARAGKHYGFSPKFVRMRMMHILLFYLVYDHPGVPKLSQQEQVKILKSKGYEMDDDLVQEFSTIYNTDVSWKMFIPPLPKHIGWSDGWTLMCDVLLGLPLYIFVKVHNITFTIPELEHYLNHPIRKYYLVKNLPVIIRNTLLHARKYIFNIHDTITRLGYIGLVQFGPQRLKDKDQVFIYVNRRTELMDTTTSAPSYHKIEDKTYPVTKYFFDSTQSVSKYWYDMWTICVNTLLGGRLVVHGKDILLEDLSKKTAMIEAVAARNPKEAAERDTGVVPGDHKGAAGLDSAFFAHLKRNWNWSSNYPTHQQTSRNYGKSGTGQRDLHLSKIQAKPVKYTEYDGLKKILGPPPPPSTVSMTELRKKVHNQLSTAGRKNEALPSHQSSRQKSFVRRVMPRKKSVRKRRLKYDEDDYRAMQQMNKLRVEWETHEDNILLVCKVATTYLSPNPRKQVVSFIAVRDVLRTFSYSSYNKTSRACQRRLMYMLRQPRTVNSVTLGIEEIKQDPFVDRRYGGVMERLKGECSSSTEYEKRVTEVFKELVGYIVKKYYDIAEIKPKEHMAMPKTVQEFNLLFEVVHPMKPSHNQGFVKDVRSINDIHSATINSIIHSSMCCGKDRRSWAYQLFMVYQHYSETLLKQAMNKIRSDQMVTVKKHHLATIKKYGNYMPMSSSQYQLSINYIYKFQTKWTYDVFKETYDVLIRLLQWYSERKNVPLQEQETEFNGIEIPISSGIVTIMHDLLARDHIDFDIEMPDQIIMLDARYQGKDDFRVAQRYQDILTRLYRFKFENVAAQNARDSETEEISQENSLKRRKLENDEPEEPMLKISRKNEESIDDKQENFQSQQNENTSLDKKRSFDESDKPEETSPRERSHEQSSKKTRANRLSRKRSANIEEDSTDCDEQLSKRARLNSEDSMDFEDSDENEESKLLEEELCDDLESIEKMLSDSSKPFKVMNELKKQIKEDPSMQPNITDMTSVPRRVSEIIKNMLPETNYFSSCSKIEDTSDVQKKYTRIAMLRMREELNDLSVTDSHHAHEYFVVNSFRMFYNLELPSSSVVEASASLDIENFKGHSVPNELIPLKIEIVNDFLDELNRTAIFPKNDISYSDYKSEIVTKKKEIAVDWKYVDAVCEFVQEKREIGVTSQELLDKFFDEQGEDLYKVASLLVENHIFLRSGVTKPRYIHHRYVDPWLIHSYKIYRLEQESLVPFKDSIYATMQPGEMNAEINAETDAKSMNLHNEEENANEKHEIDIAIASTSSDNQESKEKKNEKTDNDLINEKNEKKESSEINEEGTSRTRKRTCKQRTRLLPQKDVYKSAQQLDFTTTEEIKVAIRPWIRIDGVLNRKVLDRMLGAVLSYCLLHPGLTMVKMQSRFVPALQPYHTRELLEMLIKLGCLKSKLLKKTRVTLFSAPPVVNISNLTADTVGWSAEDEIVLEPTIDAILKFSIFLSTRTYSTDFMP